MNKNLFLKEWNRNRLSLLIWTVIISAMIFVPMTFFQTIAGNQKQFEDVLELVPKEALEFKGVINISDLFSVLGFYSNSISVSMMLLGSIFSIILSSSILLKEEYNKTAEYLLSKPLSRMEIFLTKSVVMVSNIILLNIVTTIVGWVALELFKTGPFSHKAFLTLSFSILLLNLFFGALGLFISTLVRRPRSIAVLSIGIVIVCFLFNNLSKLIDTTGTIGYLSPFKFVNTDVTNSSYHLELLNMAYFIGLFLAMMAGSAWIYRKKDILV